MLGGAQVSDSVERVSPLSQSGESYGRTDGRTNAEPPSQGDYLTLRIAHENSGESAAEVTGDTALRTETANMANGYCTVYGHEHYRIPCRGCRADELLAGTVRPARNLRGARTVLDAAPALDHARLAAGERDETDE